MPVTLQDVADIAGVSRSAVSRTFTQGASVSPKTRAKVEAAAAKLNYYPNVLASSLTTGRTKLIGLITNNFANPYYLEIIDHFSRALQDAGLRPLLVNLTRDDDATQALTLLRQYSVDGVIVASSTLPPSFAAAFQDANLPVIHAFGWSSTAPRTDQTGIDNIESGRLAARSLIARGYGNIAFLGGPRGASTSEDRLTGFLEIAGATPGLRFSHSAAADYNFEAGRAEMARLLSQAAPRAEAYFCGDDVIAIGALSAAQEAGLRVPEDIGFLGLNDMEMAGWANIALTTIRQPVERIVADAVDLIQDRIETPDAPPVLRLSPAELVERKTLRPV